MTKKGGRYSAEVTELVGRLSDAILREEGDMLLEDPSDIDAKIMTILRRVGEGTTSDVMNRLSARLVARQKKVRG